MPPAGPSALLIALGLTIFSSPIADQAAAADTPGETVYNDARSNCLAGMLEDEETLSTMLEHNVDFEDFCSCTAASFTMRIGDDTDVSELPGKWREAMFECSDRLQFRD